MNKTIGEIEALSWQQCSLGVVLGLTFMSISVLNILFLKSFYNLRHQAFVRNSMATISLMVTDLINAMILTPTLFLWFFMPPPNTYTACLLKSLPFMVSNYTSLLNMASFCVYRFIIIRKLIIGRIRVRTPMYMYGVATLMIWLTAIICVSLPYIFWNNSHKIILDCRRAVFSDARSALRVFSFLFDIPLIAMNATLFTLFILLKRYQAKVAIGYNTDICETEEDTTVAQKEENINDFVNECSPDKADSSNTVKLETQTKVRECKLFEEESSIITPDFFQINVIPIRSGTVTYFETTETDETTINNAGGDFEASKKKNILRENQINGIRKHEHETDSTVNGMSEQFQEVKQVSKTSDRAGGRPRITEERGHLFHELKQFLVTMGILVVVYDVTILPLVIDINIGARDSNFLVPHVLNSFCFLNSFCNPLVYLIRMKEMRKEMKRLLRQCYNILLCHSATGND